MRKPRIKSAYCAYGHQLSIQEKNAAGELVERDTQNAGYYPGSGHRYCLACKARQNTEAAAKRKAERARQAKKRKSQKK